MDRWGLERRVRCALWLRSDDTVGVRTDTSVRLPDPTPPSLGQLRAPMICSCASMRRDVATFEPSNDVALTYNRSVIGIMNELTTSPRSSSQAAASTPGALPSTYPDQAGSALACTWSVPPFCALRAGSVRRRW
jgi:hypothetical protein